MDGHETRPYLKVYSDRSILFNGIDTEEFLEGKTSESARTRNKKIEDTLKADYLSDIIKSCNNPHILDNKKIEDNHLELIKSLLNFTSEVGRALVGLTILQLCIKSIEPTQNIRLHKGSTWTNESRFSWSEGISMRTLDKNYITPVLREHGLLRLNADGFMMTRSLAENYPYSNVYKAATRGAKQEWLEIVNLLETDQLDAEVALYHLITLLKNKSDSFKKLSINTIENVNHYVDESMDIKEISNFLLDFIDMSSYSARIFEVVLHSFYQELESMQLLPGKLKQLTQMRSANKKHQNIGDIEVVHNHGYTTSIIEAWDAKYGKPYLRDEIEEIVEKLEIHPDIEEVGFIVNTNPIKKDEITNRLEIIKNELGIEIKILSFDEWVTYQLERYPMIVENTNTFGQRWLIAFTECLGQMRRDIAPIDEPCDVWMMELNDLLKEKLN